VRRRLEISRQHPLKERHEPPQFGYRGFVIFDEAREAGLPYRTDIFGGFVAIVEERPEAPPHAPRQPLFYRDAGQLEDWLLERAAEHGLAKDIAGMGGPYRRPP